MNMIIKLYNNNIYGDYGFIEINKKYIKDFKNDLKIYKEKKCGF